MPEPNNSLFCSEFQVSKSLVSKLILMFLKAKRNFYNYLMDEDITRALKTALAIGQAHMTNTQVLQYNKNLENNDTSCSGLYHSEFFW